MKFETINILGREYKVIYCNNPSDVDIIKRTALWGQADYWRREIRIYDNGRTQNDLLQTLLHEILHCITSDLNMSDLRDKEDDIGLLALALADVLIRNDMIRK